MLSCERIRTANGREGHVNCGGARACAFEPTRTDGIGSKASRQETSWYWRCSVTKTSGGGSRASAPPKLTAQKTAQQLAPLCCAFAGAVCEAYWEDAIPEQIAAI